MVPIWPIDSAFHMPFLRDRGTNIPLFVCVLVSDLLSLHIVCHTLTTTYQCKAKLTCSARALRRFVYQRSLLRTCDLGIFKTLGILLPPLSRRFLLYMVLQHSPSSALDGESFIGIMTEKYESLSPYIATCHFNTSVEFGKDKIFDYGIAHHAPMLESNQINRILLYPGAFNPPHHGHKALPPSFRMQHGYQRDRRHSPASG